MTLGKRMYWAVGLVAVMAIAAVAITATSQFTFAGLTDNDEPITGPALEEATQAALERINLPTSHESGLNYQTTAILFRRIGTQFELRVAPWDSSVAEAWRTASKAKGALFRLGGATARACGLI